MISWIFEHPWMTLLVFIIALSMTEINTVRLHILRTDPKKVTEFTEINGEYFDICPKCKGIIDDDMEYCHHCGQKLDWNNKL